MGRVRPFLGVVAALALAACATAPKRTAKVRPPPKALAPHALPIRSFEPLLAFAYPQAFDPADLLIGEARGLYAAGHDDYRAGNLDHAKQEFDQSLRVLLESKFEGEGRARVNAEVERLVEAIHGVELASLEHGDVSPQHAYVPSPIESFTGLTFPVDPNLTQRLEQQTQSVTSDLPLVSNDEVAGVINFFQSHPRGQEYIRTVIQRSGLYQPIIVESLRKEGLPQDLIYLAGAESAYHPRALSHASAKGMWQFVLARAEQYGLKKDRWVDEREDPAKSTQAAARHLKDLYQMFGDWYLALAAYDSGPVTIQKAVEKTGYADYWTLRRLGALPKETENYVPIFLATAFVAKNPGAFGLDAQPAPPLHPDQVRVSAPTDLRLVAQLIDRPVEEIIDANPSLLRWTTPANDPQFVLSLPPDTKELYEQRIASIPAAKRVWWRAHKVEEGETLSSLARKYHVSRVALAEANQLSGDGPLAPGAHLVLPMLPGKESSLARGRERGPLRLVHYRVKPGDTLELVADRFDVTPYQIRRWNGLKSSGLSAGKPLRLYVRGAAASSRPAGQARHHPRPQSSPSKRKSPGQLSQAATGTAASNSPASH